MLAVPVAMGKTDDGILSLVDTPGLPLTPIPVLPSTDGIHQHAIMSLVARNKLMCNVLDLAFEMNKYPSKILIVLLQPMIQSFYFRLE
jgi:hypothetical protein